MLTLSLPGELPLLPTDVQVRESLQAAANKALSQLKMTLSKLKSPEVANTNALSMMSTVRVALVVARTLMMMKSITWAVLASRSVNSSTLRMMIWSQRSQDVQVNTILHTMATRWVRTCRRLRTRSDMAMSAVAQEIRRRLDDLVIDKAWVALLNLPVLALLVSVTDHPSILNLAPAPPHKLAVRTL
jgi:hypothetical protein